MQKLIPAARDAGIPVIYSRHIFRATHDLPRATDSSYSYSELSPLSELQPEVAPQPGDLLIEKQRASLFFQTGLIYMLLNKRVDTLLITGNTTSGCIRATAVDGLVFDRIEMSHKASLFDLQFKYCDVISVDRAYQQLATVHQGRSAATVGG